MSFSPAMLDKRFTAFKYRTAICHSYFAWLVAILRVNWSVCNKGKGKGIPVHAMKAQREWKYSSILHNLSTRCRWVASFRPGHSLFHEETSGIHWVGAWEDTRTSLDILERILLVHLSVEPWIIVPVALWPSYVDSFLPKTNTNSWDS